MQPLQGAHQDPGLRLDAFDRREHQHGAIEHDENPLDLGDEVRVVPECRPTWCRQSVSVRWCRSQPIPVVDDSGEVQESLGQCGLTGVDVGEDAQVERTSGHA